MVYLYGTKIEGNIQGSQFYFQRVVNTLFSGTIFEIGTWVMGKEIEFMSGDQWSGYNTINASINNFDSSYQYNFMISHFKSVNLTLSGSPTILLDSVTGHSFNVEVTVIAGTPTYEYITCGNCIHYDNSSSGLDATTVGAAIDESLVEVNNSLFVDTNGNDTTGDGSMYKPYASIQHAIDNSTTQTIIYVNAGNYSENINISASITIIGFCGERVIITGKTTITSSSDSTIVFKNLQFVNINDFCVDYDAGTDNTLLKIVRCKIINSWTNGTGQTVTSSKSAFKLSRGIFKMILGIIEINASGDSTNEHNTSAFWVTSSGKVNHEAFSVEHIITNTTDTSQNLEVIFNNNTNSETVFNFKNGFMRLTGVVDGQNYISPFYNYSSSADKGYVDGNQLILVNSSHSYTSFNYDSSCDIVFSNNSIFPTNISDLHIAETFTATGTIYVQNTYYDVPTMPDVAGDVVYSVYLQDGSYHSSGDVISNTLTLSGLLNSPQHSSDPSGPQEGSIYFNTSSKKLRVYDGTSWIDLH